MALCRARHTLFEFADAQHHKTLLRNISLYNIVGLNIQTSYLRIALKATCQASNNVAGWLNRSDALMQWCFHFWWHTLNHFAPNFQTYLSKHQLLHQMWRNIFQKIIGYWWNQIRSILVNFREKYQFLVLFSKVYYNSLLMILFELIYVGLYT